VENNYYRMKYKISNANKALVLLFCMATNKGIKRRAVERVETERK
jgi:hypothetical protein